MTVIIPNIWRIVEFPTKLTTYPPSINCINICCKSKWGRDGFQTLVSSMFHFVKLGVVAFDPLSPQMFDGERPYVWWVGTPHKYIYIYVYIILYYILYNIYINFGHLSHESTIQNVCRTTAPGENARESMKDTKRVHATGEDLQCTAWA